MSPFPPLTGPGSQSGARKRHPARGEVPEKSQVADATRAWWSRTYRLRQDFFLRRRSTSSPYTMIAAMMIRKYSAVFIWPVMSTPW